MYINSSWTFPAYKKKLSRFSAVAYWLYKIIKKKNYVITCTSGVYSGEEIRCGGVRTSDGTADGVCEGGIRNIQSVE